MIDKKKKKKLNGSVIIIKQIHKHIPVNHKNYEIQIK